jgi:hypothetical protein
VEPPPPARSPYGPGWSYARPVPPTNTLAVISLALALFASPAGLICGVIALDQIKRTGERGYGMAVAGTVISAVGLVLTGLLVLVIFISVLAGHPIAETFPSPSPS